MITIEQLELQIKELQEELEKIQNNDNNGNVCPLKLIYCDHIKFLIIICIVVAESTKFFEFFNRQIERMTRVLYWHQREKSLPVQNADEFVNLIETRDPELRGFFDILFRSMNPDEKNKKTQQQLRQKIMMLCYQMASLRNKQVSGAKAAIGLYMTGAGVSTVGINTLSNMGISATYQTVYNNKKKIVDAHEQNVQKYIANHVRNLENLICFVIYEYFNINININKFFYSAKTTFNF